MKARLIHALVALAPLTCSASEPIGKHRPSLDSVRLLRDSSYPAFAVGDFVVAPHFVGDTTSVTVRFHKRVPANGETFASYLKASIVRELKAAGKYDPSATTVIAGELSESQLDGGSAALGARITVTRFGQNIYDKVLREESRWETAFLGETAIPEAFNQYTALYSKLMARLFQDDAFKTAITP